jgi:hypothetical protein
MNGTAKQVSSWIQAMASTGWTRDAIRKTYGKQGLKGRNDEADKRKKKREPK